MGGRRADVLCLLAGGPERRMSSNATDSVPVEGRLEDVSLLSLRLSSLRSSATLGGTIDSSGIVSAVRPVRLCL